MLKSILRFLLMNAVFVVLALIAEIITPLKQLTLHLNENPQPYKGIVIALSVAGWVLLLVTLVVSLAAKGKSRLPSGVSLT